MDLVISARRDSRCVKRKCDGGVGGRESRIQVSGRFFDMFKEGIRGRRRRVGEGSGIEKIRARRKDNGKICSRIQEGCKRKWIQGEAVGGGV